MSLFMQSKVRVQLEIVIGEQQLLMSQQANYAAYDVHSSTPLST